ncbi:MAG: MlaA family lipoprotein [Caulobacteraceae bacterium]
MCSSPSSAPPTSRDVLGTLADLATDPLGWQPFRNGQITYSRTIIDGLDQRAEADGQLQAIDNMSTDTYASLRSLYQQNRSVQIADAVAGSRARSSRPSTTSTIPRDPVAAPGRRQRPRHRPGPRPSSPAPPSTAPSTRCWPSRCAWSPAHPWRPRGAG